MYILLYEQAIVEGVKNGKRACLIIIDGKMVIVMLVILFNGRAGDISTSKNRGKKEWE